jgi:heptosyltransferase-3
MFVVPSFVNVLLMPSKSILIYRLGSLGDTVVALPAFHAIRRAFPNQRLTLLTNKPVSSKAPPVAAVLGDSYFVDDVIGYPLHTRNPFTLFRLVVRMRARKVGTVVNLAAFRSFARTRRDAVFFRMAGAQRLIGFDLNSRDAQGWCDPETGETEWEASRIARRVKDLEQVSLEQAENWDLLLSPSEHSIAVDLLSGVSTKSKLLAVSIGTKVPAKDWGLENWNRLLAKMFEEFPDWTVLFCGSSEEGARSDECAQYWKGASINVCGKTSPRETAALLKQCRFFVGHDSGPMHLAACVDTPCVAIFSARSLPRQWFPRGRLNRVIYRRTECAGCSLSDCVVEKKRCLLSITPDEVLLQVRELVRSLS